MSFLFLVSLLVMAMYPSISSTPPKLFVVCGPCGAGKTSLVNKIFQDQELLLSCNRLVSWTSRSLRQGEAEGKDFFFAKQACEFEQKKIENGFLIVKEIAGNIYGLPVPEKENSIAVLDIASALEIKQKNANVHLIVILEKPEVLVQRILGRGELSVESFQARINHNSSEFDLLSQENNRICFDCEIINSDLEMAFLELKSFLLRHI